jgi:hypothetical protein
MSKLAMIPKNTIKVHKKTKKYLAKIIRYLHTKSQPLAPVTWNRNVKSTFLVSQNKRRKKRFNKTL